MAILRNLPANIVSEIRVKVQFATHEEWQQNLGNGLLSCLHKLSTLGFHQSEHPKSLCCSAVQQVHYYVLICIYQVD